MNITDRFKHVVIVVADALRPDHLGCYGYEHPVSPTLDDLAANSYQFERAFACINNTDPSVTSIHSGIHPTSSVLHQGGRVTMEDKRRAEALPRVPELLGSNGYHRTWTGHALGRWHRNGFDYTPPSRPTHEKRILFESDDDRERLRLMLERFSPRLADVVSDAYYQFEQTIGDFQDQIRNSQSPDGDEIDALLAQFDVAAEQREQFFGYTHLIDTHAPYESRSDLVEQYLDEHDYENEPFDKIVNPDPPDCSPIAHVPYTDGWFSDRDREVGTARWKAKYDACVTAIDDKVRRLLTGLEERGVLNDTLLVVTADHGESLDEHGIYFSHVGLRDPTLQVPLLIRVPGSSGGHVDSFVQLIDLAPTVLSAFDEPFDESMFHGRSLLPLLDGDGDWQPRDSLLFEEANAQRRRAIRTDEYKYIYAIDGEQHADRAICRYCDQPHWEEAELYDLKNDPGEIHNIASERPELAENLRERAEDLARQFRTEATGVEDEEITYDDEEVVEERLRQLGYK